MKVRTLLLFLLPLYSFAQVQTIELSENWTFKKSGDTNWLIAQVPGTVQEDMLRLGEIPDPFFSNNEEKIQWIESESWEYQTTFLMDKKQLAPAHHELHFKGLDTYASVYLNDKKILDADNMFRQWIVDVSDHLKEKNTLRIVFHSPIQKGKTIIDQLPYELPAGNDAGEVKVSSVVRKAGYHFGWDWGPRIVTMGIWRPIQLVSYNDTRLNNVFVQQQTLHDTLAELTLNMQLSKKTKKLKARIYVNDKLAAKGDVKANYIKNELAFTIKNPQRWMPNTWGKAQLYNIKVELLKGKKIIDTWEDKIGLRTVELVRQTDDIGTPFYFKINGKAIFAKGANYIPQSHFIAAKTEADYRRLLQDAVDANMNMLRVWGGGIYENDVFYDLCDEMGIMVWQDFMFANTMYPNDEHFLNNIKAEVKDNILRLRQHPSIVHWCGNNEIDVAWYNWGWQKQYNYSKSDSKELRQTYETIFQKIIPKQLTQLLPDAPYSHTSPLSNWGKPENFNHSSMHYWGVFHGEDPFSDYANNVGRFNSEYGFQSLPTWNTLQSFLPESEQQVDSKILDTRQKSYKGNRLMFTHLKRHFPETKDLKTLSYLTQLTQALGIRYAIEQHRIQQPHCMGTLYWQLNDCWPAISWSGIDNSGEWRALHYRVKDAYQDLAVFIDERDEIFEAILVNDKIHSRVGNLQLQLMDFSGQVIFEKKQEITLEPQSVTTFTLDDFKPFTEKVDKDKLVLFARYYNDNQQIDALHYFAPPKDLKLPNSQITHQLFQEKEGIRISLTSPVLIKNLWLQTDVSGHFFNNYFDLAPNSPYQIMFKTKYSLEEFEQGFEMMNLNQLINAQ